MQSTKTFITEPVNMEIAAPAEDDTLNAAPRDYKFKAVHIKHNYSENSPSNHRQYETVEELIADTKDPKDCVYEVLDKPMRKLYMDLECIEHKYHTIIVNKIVTAFQEFIGEKARYHITFNSGSKGHPGASYHVVFEAKANYVLQKNLILSFKQLYPEYTNYIDESVYSVFRLFRLPNQCKQRDHEDPDPTDVHLIMTADTTEKDMIIQDIYNDIPEITVNSLPNETVRRIGNIALENKHPVNEKGRSGTYSRNEMVSTIATQMTELKDSNARLERKIERLEAINNKLFDYLTKLLENK